MRKEINIESIKRKRIKTKKILAQKKFLLLLAISVMLYLTLFFGRLHYTNYVDANKLREVTKKNKQLNSEYQKLSKEKEKFLTPEYIEKYARQKLFMVKKNEGLLRVNSRDISEMEKENNKKTNFYDKIKKQIKKIF